MPELDLKSLPRHVAIIMDGNGRWAKLKLRNRIHGHKEGANSVRDVVSTCRRLGIPYLTLYAFSKENWNRPSTEIRALWGLLDRYLKSELPEFISKEIRLLHIGDAEGIPEYVLKHLRNFEENTAGFDKLIVNLALNYGGRQEIVRAAKLFAGDILNGRFGIGEISPQLFSRYLYTAGCPDPDLVIRTGGEIRVSNFLLWQLAYAELYFTEVLWPDFREANLIAALREFQSRERRYGRTGEQVKSFHEVPALEIGAKSSR
ncbi:MAG: isoprenyl transferase [Syntrophobacteraceae bacterium]